MKDEMLTLISYLIAAALIIPIGWWLKANYAHDLGGWILGWFQ